MTVDQYFQKRLASLKQYTLTADEEKMLQMKQLEEFIFRRITSKKFRRNKLTEATLKSLREKVHRTVQNQAPLYFIFAFGGYKNHQVTNHQPHTEWGEVFNLMFVTELLAPILGVYKPGAIYEFESEGQAVVVGNNYFQADIDTYTADFHKLIEFFKDYIPENLTYRYLTLREQYSTESLFYEVGKHVPEKMLELQKLPKEEFEHMMKRAKMNLKLNGRVDLTGLSESELDQRALESLAHNHIFLEEDYKLREHYFNGDERIPIVGTYISDAENVDNWITLNSCARSANAFWTSRGILRKQDDSFVDDIVGPTTYAELRDNLQTQTTSAFADVVQEMGSIEVTSS